MNAHRGNQSGIMHLNARDLAGNHQPPPFRMNLRPIRQEREQPFDHLGSSIRFGYGQSKSVDRRGANANPPKLDMILGRVADLLASLLKHSQR